MEARIVAKYVTMSPVLDERSRRLWAAAESINSGFGGDTVVWAATGPARATIRKGRQEIEAGVEAGVEASDRLRRPGAGRPGVEDSQPGLGEALERWSIR